MDKKIPVYVLSGFLGSGKTTVLLNMVKELKKQNKTPGIVLNELGEVNVENDLFQDEQLLELLNGCICCSIQADLTDELVKFIDTTSKVETTPDILIIEGTGVANPLEIVSALSEPMLIERLELQSIISVVDASKYLEYQSIFSSSKEIRTVLKDQMSNSTLVIVNKTDLVSEKQLNKVRKKINNTVKEHTQLIETEFGNVSIGELLKKRMSTVIVHGHHCEHEHCDQDHGHEHHSHHNHHNHAFQTIKIDEVPVFDRVQLERWFQQLPENVVRGKGIVRLVESPGLFQFQYSSKQFRIQRVTNVENREPCMIIIGYSLNIDEIKQSFELTFV